MPSGPAPGPSRGRRRRGGGCLVAIVIVVAVVVGPPVTITLVNDAAARRIENELVALPLPAGTERVGSASRAAKLTGNGNGMQYLGAIFVRSELSIADLQAYYDDASDSTGLSVTVSDAGALDDMHGGPIGAGLPSGTRIVWAWGDGPGELFEEFDIRGH